MHHYCYMAECNYDYLPLPVKFILPFFFKMMLISTPLLPFEKLPLVWVSIYWSFIFEGWLYQV